MDKIKKVRKDEIQIIERNLRIQSLFLFFSNFLTIAVNILIFALYSIMEENQLTCAKALTVIGLFYQIQPVSYTHLTLPTKRIVQISVVAGSLKKKKKEKKQRRAVGQAKEAGVKQKPVVSRKRLKTSR
eukprot:TRINITY_DN8728_c0_g2_i1.p2 TRINITY_DN8728_c0_g2~~TRINITY_DN8728_c0_g2_i1.p2  ORF type:complete len:129 (-),score=27.15 TRINITY_DN8728_c0_g2_i1:1-387(-)